MRNIAADESSGLRPAQHRALAALLDGCSHKEAAQRAEVSERTLRNWLRNDAAFRVAYDSLCAQLLSQVKDSLRLAAPTAASTLHELAGNANIAPAHRIAASRIILENAMRVAENEAIEARIAELERMVRDAS